MEEDVWPEETEESRRREEAEYMEEFIEAVRTMEDRQ